MGSTSVLHATVLSSLSFRRSPGSSRPIFIFRNCLGQNIKHLTYIPLKTSTTTTTQRVTKPHFSPLPRCSYSNSNPKIQVPIDKILNLSFIPSFNISQLTPFNVCKWSAIICFSIAASKKTIATLLNPFFWMYFSWTWIYWPWIAAISLAIYGFYCLWQHSQQKASIFEQLVVVTSAFAWLTLVPPAHFNGFLEGWPIVFFLVYHYFFFFSISIRKRLYGDLYPRVHDPKWDVGPPSYLRTLFSIALLAGHWFAAAEGPELHLVSGGWSNVAIWFVIAVALFMQYNASLYLAKYSEKVVVPTAVVQFGPYRWVRHPIYASTMLLFATYCAALRAPLSLLFVVGVCVAYYDQKAKLEEQLMLETFGERYKDYMAKVRYKLIPLVY